VARTTKIEARPEVSGARQALRAARHAALGAALGALAACAVGPSYRPPKPDVPAAFAAQTPQTPGGAPAAPAELATWWHALGDAELDSLVDRAIKANLDLDIALTQLQQARTYEVVIAGHALPEVEATGSEARGTGSDLARGRASQGLRSADNSTGLSHLNTVGGFDAVWELDIFGKYRRAMQAARFDAEAAAAARNGVLTAVVADVVHAYIDLRGDQTELGVLRQASDVLRESLRIVKIRYERGITNELDVALATRELNTLDAQIAPEQAAVSAAESTLAVLLAEYPESMASELGKPDLIPSVPDTVSAGVPLDLLKRRPDVQQAERELGAATARIGVATAELFPQVSLVGAIGAQQGNVPGPLSARTVGKHIWSFGPAAMWPLLDFGALDAQVDIADLEARASLTSYRKTLINAVREVDDSLDAYQAQRTRLQDLGLAMLAGQRAVELATARYNRGLTDFLNVVDAERQYYDLQEQYAAAQIGQGEEFVQLYKSLGGGWQNYQDVPPIRRPQPAIVAAFRRALGGGEP
jgi:NodT family efflux transporter outer membrane factor (OMF) lipoprotein